MRLQEKPSRSTHSPRRSVEILSFVRGAIGLRFEMRFEWETQWWPVDAQEVGETLFSYHSCLERCLQLLVDGSELRTGLAHFRLR